jgi:hypothetical protein
MKTLAALATVRNRAILWQGSISVNNWTLA